MALQDVDIKRIVQDAYDARNFDTQTKHAADATSSVRAEGIAEENSSRHSGAEHGNYIYLNSTVSHVYGRERVLNYYNLVQMVGEDND